MKTLMEKSLLLAVIPVLFTLVAAVAVMGWGAVKTVDEVVSLFSADLKDPQVPVGFIKVMDIFLIAIGLLFFAVAVYELFIADLELPGWLQVSGLASLKTKLSSILILVMAITFVEHLIEWNAARAMLYFGVGISVVSAALVVFNLFGAEGSAKLPVTAPHKDT